jgi:hypothetical protein
MPNCLSTSACHISLSAGQGVIVEGGSHYHYFTGSPQVGLPTGWPTGANSYAWNIPDSGAPGAEIYIGVDQGWFLGTTWARPIFDNDNPTFLPPNPSPAQTTAGWASTAVASCAFPNGSLVDIVLNGVTYVQLDNFEFTGICWNNIPTNGSTGSMEEAYIKHFGVGSQAVSWRRITNMFWHGWSHTAFNSGCPGTTTGTCGSATATIGPSSVAAQGTLFAFDVSDGFDSDDLSFSPLGDDTDGYDYEESVMRHVGPVNIPSNCHSLHDNLFEYINNSAVPGSHTDMWFCVSEFGSNNFYYNNLIRYVGTEYNQASLSAVVWTGGTQPGVTCGSVCTDYIFNNVGHDVNCQGDCWNFAGASTGTGTGGVTNYNIYNNTWEMTPSPGGGGSTSPVWANINSGSTVFTSQNNYYIIANAGQAANCTGVFALTTNVNGGNTSCSGDVFQTLNAANNSGSNSANDFGIITGSPALGAGVNESNLVPTFGTAFGSTSTNGCNYNLAGTHAVTCPAQNPALRAITGGGAWNAGANGASVPSAAVSFLWSGNVNPSSVALGSSAVTATSSAQTVTICNGSISTGGACTASGATLTISAMALSGVNSADFSFSTNPSGGNDCGGSLAAGSTCVISITIKPSLIGPESATFTVTDSASGSPQSFSVNGTGVSQVSVSPSTQSFGNIPITTPSSELLTLVTNNGSTSVTSLAVSVSGASAGLYVIDTTSTTLGGISNCAKVTSLAANATCNAGVTFTPVAVGNNFLATLNFTDSASGSPQTVSLSGNGIGSQPIVPNNPSAFAVLRPFELP